MFGGDFDPSEAREDEESHREVVMHCIPLRQTIWHLASKKIGDVTIGRGYIPTCGKYPMKAGRGGGFNFFQ